MNSNCTQCGAAVPLTLAGPEPTCRQCGATEPLSAEAAKRLHEVRARLARREQRAGSLNERLLSEAELASFGGISLWICWLFFGGLAYVTVVTSVDIPVLKLALRPPDELELFGEWWVLYCLVVGLPLSLGLHSLSMVWLRRLRARGLPLPPAYPGAQPRCRCCGAELPPGTSLRRCTYCRADNLVLGEHYQRSELALDRSVEQLVRDFNRSLDGRIKWADRVGTLGALAPLALLLVVPVLGMLSRVTRPEWWPYAAVAWGFAALMLGLARLTRLPDGKTL